MSEALPVRDHVRHDISIEPVRAKFSTAWAEASYEAGDLPEPAQPALTGHAARALRIPRAHRDVEPRPSEVNGPPPPASAPADDEHDAVQSLEQIERNTVRALDSVRPAETPPLEPSNDLGTPEPD